LVRRDGFQHNRKLRDGGAYDRNAVTQIVAEVIKATASSATAIKEEVVADAALTLSAPGSAAA